jgi:hypothetical protein
VIGKLTESDDLYTLRYYLLEQLASIKFFSLLTDEEEGLSNGEVYIERLFTTCFEVVSAEKKARIHFLLPMTEILAGLLEIMESIPNSIIELLLDPLLQKKKVCIISAYSNFFRMKKKIHPICWPVTHLIAVLNTLCSH